MHHATRILDHRELQFEQKYDKHYAQVITDHKEKCQAVSGIVLLCQSLHYYLLMKELIHTVYFLSHVSQVLPFIGNDQDIVYNNNFPEISQSRQINEAAAESENLPSAVVSKGPLRKSEG